MGKREKKRRETRARQGIHQAKGRDHALKRKEKPGKGTPRPLKTEKVTKKKRKITTWEEL